MIGKQPIDEVRYVYLSVLINIGLLEQPFNSSRFPELCIQGLQGMLQVGQLNDSIPLMVFSCFDSSCPQTGQTAFSEVSQRCAHGA